MSAWDEHWTRLNRFVTTFGPPAPAPDDPPSRIFGEGAATLWMWAWPRMIGWHRRSSWLFSLATGNRVRPGDVWGVDSDGELILVEGKTCEAGRRSHDPFEDFVNAGASVLDPACGVTSAEALEKLWRRRLERERKFIAEHLSHLKRGDFAGCRHSGVVPYGRRRGAVRVWGDLYAEHLAPMLGSNAYVASVERNLRTRRERPNRPPHCVALLVSIDGAEPTLSARGETHRQELIAQIGADHVHAVTVTSRVGSAGVTLTSERWASRAQK